MFIARKMAKQKFHNVMACGNAISADPVIVMFGTNCVGARASGAVVTFGVPGDGSGNVGVVNDKGRAALFRFCSPDALVF
jgi:hypothetical protein